MLDGSTPSASSPSATSTARARRHAGPAPRRSSRARATFTAYRAALSSCAGRRSPASLPRDPGYLSWTLAALPAPHGRAAVAARGRGRRASGWLVTGLLREELRAIKVIPSLPATEVARTRWSPN